MKFLSFLIVMSAFNAHAERLANGAASPRATVNPAPRVEPFSAAEFLEVIHPNHPRNPNWPERLTFTPITSISHDEALEQIQGRWRVVYQCHGQPVQPNPILADGINGPILIQEFKVDVMRRLVRQEDESIRLRVESLSRFQMESQGSGEFLVRFEHTFNPSLYRFVRVNETNEIVIESSSTGLDCPDGTRMKGLRIRLPTS